MTSQPTSTGLDYSLIAAAVSDQKTIIVPNSRLREALLQTILDNESVVVARRPPVYAIDIWVKQTWQQLAQTGREPCASRSILSASEELLLWLRVVEASLDQFPLLNPQQTAIALGQAYQLQRQWQLDKPDMSDLERYNGIDDVRVFLRWQQHFSELCDQHHCFSLVDAVEQLHSIAAEHRLPGSNHGYLLVNFFQPPPLYEALLESLPNSSHARTSEPEKLLINHLRAERREYSELREEIRACCHWAAEHIREQPDVRVGVICLERQKCEPLFTRFLRDALEPEAVLNLQSDVVHFEGASSHPLADTAVVADALQALQLHREQQHSDDICRLLRSPFIGATDNEQEARLQMELLMRRRFSSSCSLASLAVFLEREGKPHHCPQLRRRLLQFRTLLRGAPKRSSAIRWAALFRQLLECLNWPGDSLSRQEHQAVRLWLRTLENFAQCSDLLQTMDMNSALSRLRLLCQQTQREPVLRGTRQISLLTPTEAAGLQFDHLWLLNFTDQNFPAPVSPAAFLPYELQKQHELPGSHSDSQYRQCRQDFNVLCNATGKSLVASHGLSDGEQEFRASSFTLDFPLQTVSEPARQSLNHYLSVLAPRPALHQFATASPAPLAAEETIRGGAAVISDQSACPFRAFARHRLQVDPLESFSSGLDQRARGTAVHIALEHLYNRIPGQSTLHNTAPDTRLAWIDAAVDEALDYLYRLNRELLTPRFRRLEQQRLRRLLEEFLELEKQRGDFQVVATESELSWRADRLALHLKVDRIDRLADQSLAIIDYKTGRQLPGQGTWLQERPENMQLPLYAVAARSALDEPVGAICLARVNAEKHAYTGLAASANFHRQVKPLPEADHQDWLSLGQQFAVAVTAMATEFENGIQRVDPVNGNRTCEFCRLQSLCRIFTAGQDDNSGSAFAEEEQ